MKNSWILTMCRKQTEMKSNVKDFFSEWYIYIILIVFWVTSCSISPYFRTISNFSNIFESAVPIALIGLGQTIVILSGGFDLSVGVTASLATAIASETMGLSITLGILLVLGVSFVVGLINGFGVSKFNIESFIMTLGMMFLLKGIAFLLRPTPGGYIPESFQKALLYKISGFSIVAVLILILVAVIGITVLQRRKFGREIYAVGGDPNAAKMAGINVDKTKIKAFIISAICAGLGGLFIAARIGSGNSNAGDPYLFDSFTVVFMGGTLVTGGIGGYKGTFGSTLIIASLSSILQFMGITIWYHFIIKGLLLAGVVGIQLYIIRRRTS
mgnify:CR=1 FL=1